MSEPRGPRAWIVALISIFIVVGSLFTALQQGGFFETPPTAVPATPSPTHTAVSGPDAEGNHSPTTSPSPTASPTPSPTACMPPASWLAYIVQPGDTLDSLAQAVGISASQVLEANCLENPDLQPGATIYLPELPPTPTPSPSPTVTNTGTSPPTSTVISCGPPPGWVKYTVRVGDTLFSLSQALGVTVAQLQQANCLGGSTLITVGQSLWVPFLPPLSSQTPTSSPTGTASSTPKPTATGTLTPQATPTSSPTSQATPTSSPTQQPTQTLPPSATPSPTPMGNPPTPSVTPTPTGT